MARVLRFPIAGPLPLPSPERLNAALRRLGDPWYIGNAADAREERRRQRHEARLSAEKWERDLATAVALLQAAGSGDPNLPEQSRAGERGRR